MTTSGKHTALLTFTDALSFILATNISPGVPWASELCVISIFLSWQSMCQQKKRGLQIWDTTWVRLLIGHHLWCDFKLKDVKLWRMENCFWSKKFKKHIFMKVSRYLCCCCCCFFKSISIFDCWTCPPILKWINWLSECDMTVRKWHGEYQVNKYLCLFCVFSLSNLQGSWVAEIYILKSTRKAFWAVFSID